MKNYLDLDAGATKYARDIAKRESKSYLISVSQWQKLGNWLSFDVRECEEQKPPIKDSKYIKSGELLEYNSFYQDNDFPNHRLIINHPAQYAIDAEKDGDSFDQVSHNFPGGDEYCLLDQSAAVQSMLNIIKVNGELVLREGFDGPLEEAYENRFKKIVETQRENWETFAEGSRILTSEEIKLHDFCLSSSAKLAEFRFRRTS